MRTLVALKQVSTRKIAGTSWPVTHTLVKEVIKANGKATWIVTVGLCNGIADYGKEFKTRKEAFNYFLNVL